MFRYGNVYPAVWKNWARPTPECRSPARTASATRSALAQDWERSLTGFVSAPSANWLGWPATPQTDFGYLGECSRFITTVPTARMPSSLERLDSKYMTRAMHS